MRGISHVLERRRLFPHLTVRQNVWLGGNQAALDDGFDLRSKAKATIIVLVKKRLYSVAISSQVQYLLFCVPDRKRKHAV